MSYYTQFRRHTTSAIVFYCSIDDLCMSACMTKAALRCITKASCWSSTFDDQEQIWTWMWLGWDTLSSGQSTQKKNLGFFHVEKTNLGGFRPHMVPPFEVQGGHLQVAFKVLYHWRKGIGIDWPSWFIFNCVTYVIISTRNQFKFNEFWVDISHGQSVFRKDNFSISAKKRKWCDLDGRPNLFLSLLLQLEIEWGVKCVKMVLQSGGLFQEGDPSSTPRCGVTEPVREFLVASPERRGRGGRGVPRGHCGRPRQHIPCFQLCALPMEHRRWGDMLSPHLETTRVSLEFGWMHILGMDGHSRNIIKQLSKNVIKKRSWERWFHFLNSTFSLSLMYVVDVDQNQIVIRKFLSCHLIWRGHKRFVDVKLLQLWEELLHIFLDKGGLID